MICVTGLFQQGNFSLLSTSSSFEYCAEGVWQEQAIKSTSTCERVTLQELNIVHLKHFYSSYVIKTWILDGPSNYCVNLQPLWIEGFQEKGQEIESILSHFWMAKVVRE